jgi:predicted transcriptional regulator
MEIENSLAKRLPEMAAEWHPIKNSPLTPSDIVIGSGKKIWWLCPVGHTWRSIMKNRARGGSCPYCSGKLATPENNLLVKQPSLAAEWHVHKNRPVKPQEVTIRSCTSYWWKCQKNHEWESPVRYRVQGGKCPYCIGRLVVPEKSLAVKYPELVKQWHPSKNSNQKPSVFLPKSGKKIWWLCTKGHEWIAAISVRTKGSKCPFCSSRKACADNNLAVLYPQLAAEWSHKKNGVLGPEGVTPRSSQKVWWVCSQGHEWKTKIRARVNGSGCIRCYRDKISVRNKWFSRIESSADADIQSLLRLKNMDEGSETLDPYGGGGLNVQNQNILADTASLIDALRKQLAEAEEKLRALESKEKQQHQDILERLTKCNKEKTKLQEELNRITSSYIKANGTSISNPRNAWKSHGVLVVQPENICVAKVRKMLVDDANRQYGETLMSLNVESSSQSSDSTSQKIESLPVIQEERHRLLSEHHEKEDVVGSEFVTEKKIEDLDETILITPVQKTKNCTTVTCLECGAELPSLGWHLKVSHGMDSMAYRKKFNLPADSALSASSLKSMDKRSLHMLTIAPKFQSSTKFSSV